MTEEKGAQTRNYWKILKIVGILAGISLIVVIILGYLFDFIFYSMLIYLTIIVSIIGYVGGIWLWEYLTSSELLKEDFKVIIRMGGLVVFIGFTSLIMLGIFLSFTAPASFLESLITIMNWLMLFGLAYNIGYLVSIWRPALEDKSEEDTDSGERFKVDWNVVKAVIKVCAPPFFVIMGATFVVGIIQGDLGMVVIPLIIHILLFAGVCVGYIVWEHLKRTNLISGKFLLQLRWISIIFVVLLGVLTIYGFILVFTEPIPVQLFRDLLLYYSIFFICMFFYFVGLYVSVVRSK